MESIHKIPVNEAFSENCGCPICRLRARYEEKAVWFLYEEGIMNPETRIQTNKKGFCREHLNMLSKEKQSLSLALMLETRLEILQNELKGKSSKGAIKTIEKESDTCFICEHIDDVLDEIAGLISQMYKEEDFRTKFKAQEFFCLPHTALLLSKNELKGSLSSKYINDILSINQNFSENIRKSLKSYAESFDYKSVRGSGNSVKDASRRAIEFMSGK